MRDYEGHYEDHGFDLDDCPVCDETADELAEFAKPTDETLDEWERNGDHFSIGSDPWAAAHAAGTPELPY